MGLRPRLLSILMGAAGFNGSCILEVTCRLHHNTNVKGQTHRKTSFGLGQNDAMCVRTYAHLDMVRDLLEDALRFSVFQDHFRV